MGTKHPDQIGIGHWRQTCETVGKMYEKGWDLHGRCNACDLLMLVDFRVLIAMRGPDFIPWNRKTRCRRIVFAGRCKGFVEFEFRAPGMTEFRQLKAAPADRLSDAPVGHVMRAFYEEIDRKKAAKP
ncbi:hypothetical protein [Phenylobacterium sp.]|uniref:hypothetical protein n=1 Tax=Phenylobacterium sp. TaxID=1871053 RepID=UPI0025E2F5E9|nr:hypothetical protein [Phenylobacterium sp.]MBX3482565.1 hypothetical protein [Phenylobacterium sp.]